jgi:Uma2 family endonuclease
MAVQPKLRMSVEEFDEWVEQPEQDDKLYEYIGGEIVEVPSNAYASQISMRFVIRMGRFIEEHDLGHITGEAGGYRIAGDRYAPDVAFVSKARQSQLDKTGYNQVPPDLAVEVDFPSTPQSRYQLEIKRWHYQQAGTVVWMVYPEDKTVVEYIPGQPPKIYGIDDTLDGGTVLPGFTLALKDIFRE